MFHTRISDQAPEATKVDTSFPGMGPVAGTPCGRFQPLDSIEDRLFSEMNIREATETCLDFKVLFVGFEGDFLGLVRDLFRSVGVSVAASCRSFDRLPDLTEIGEGFTHLVVNAEAFEAAENALGRLMHFRRQLDGVAVLVLSPRAVGDDFGTERDAICDGTVSVPLSTERVKEALLEAAEKRVFAKG